MATTIANVRFQDYTVYCGRGRDRRTGILSPWGNKFSHIRDRETLAEFLVNTRDEAVDAHRIWLARQDHLLVRLDELLDQTLGCWCAPARCHCENLAEFAEKKCRTLSAAQWSAFLEQLRRLPLPNEIPQPQRMLQANLWNS
jgi:hypothetical protein